MKILYQASVGYRWVFAFKRVLEITGFLFFVTIILSLIITHSFMPHWASCQPNFSHLSSVSASGWVCLPLMLLFLPTMQRNQHVWYSRAMFSSRYWSQQPLTFASSETGEGNVVIAICSSLVKPKEEIWSCNVFKAARQIPYMPVCIWLKCALQTDAPLSSPLMI